MVLDAGTFRLISCESRLPEAATAVTRVTASSRLCHLPIMMNESVEKRKRRVGGVLLKRGRNGDREETVVEVGEEETAEWGIRKTYALARLCRAAQGWSVWHSTGVSLYSLYSVCLACRLPTCFTRLSLGLFSPSSLYGAVVHQFQQQTVPLFVTFAGKPCTI